VCVKFRPLGGEGWERGIFETKTSARWSRKKRMDLKQKRGEIQGNIRAVCDKSDIARRPGLSLKKPPSPPVR
jgi:hypothetical protein